MNFRIAVTTFSVCLLAYGVGACSSKWKGGDKAQTALPATSPSVGPTPKPKPYIAYLHEGDLWLIESDGANQRVIAAAPEGETIQDFVWAVDGSRLYFSICLQL